MVNKRTTGPRTPESFFGDQVRTARKLRGWSQETLAQQLREVTGVDLHQTAITRLEQAQRPIRVNEFTALVQLLDLDISMYKNAGRPLTDDEDYAAAQARLAEVQAQIDNARSELEALRSEFFERQRQQEIRLQLLETELSSLEFSIYGYEHAEEISAAYKELEQRMSDG